MDDNFAHPLLSQFWQSNNRVFLLGSKPGEDVVEKLLSEGSRSFLHQDHRVVQAGRAVTFHMLRFEQVVMPFKVPAKGVPGAFRPLRDIPGAKYEIRWFEAEKLEDIYRDLWLGLKRRYREDQVDGERAGIFSHYYFDLEIGHLPTVLCIEHGNVTRSNLPRPSAF